MNDLPKGQIVVRGDDVGVVGAVVVEVDGAVVCALGPSTVLRTMESSGRSSTALTFGAGGYLSVRWETGGDRR
jgi:hypothetical protein